MTRREDESEEVDVAHFDLGAVYQRYRDLMHRVASAKLRDSGRTSEAGDVVQDVIVGMMSSPPTGVKNWSHTWSGRCRTRSLTGSDQRP